MGRWDDMRRAILAKDPDGTEQIWLELVESGPGDLPRFIEMSRLVSRQPGGRRQAGVLLWLLVDALKTQERWRDLIGIYRQLADTAPDDGTVRNEAVDAVTKAFAGREDLELLLERSGLRAGLPNELSGQIEVLERSLQIEKDAYVYHKSGWGVGKVVDYDPHRGRCVIDFRTRPGHEMDVDAASKILERLEPDDIRVMAMEDPRGLRKMTKESPLVVLKQVVGWYGNAVQLANVKKSLVPDAVAPSTWSTWWKSAKRLALLDPRFDIGPGRDPRIEVHEVGEADFRSQIETALKRCATAQAKQKVVSELATTVGENEEARTALAETVEREMERIGKNPAARIGWELTLASVRGEDPAQRLAGLLGLMEGAMGAIQSVTEDRVRGLAAEAYAADRPDRVPELVEAALDGDDPAIADVALRLAKKGGDNDTAEGLLNAADSKPAQKPNLWSWYLKGLIRGKWDGRTYEPGPLVKRMLKVIDAVEYRQRRQANAKDKKAVTALGDVLEDKSCALMKAAVEAMDPESAQHLHHTVGSIRGLRNILVTRLEDAITAVHPTAARKVAALKGVEEEEPAAAAPNQIYMTAAGMERMRTELKQLENEEMPANRAEIARAREFGDLKENAEYHAAREKQGMLEARFESMKAELQRAVEITSAIVASDAVSVGSRVHLKDTSGEEVTYTLFGPPDVDVGQGIINYMTPLGQALMGRSTGDHVRLEIEGEVRELEVLGFESAV
ncbi:MAG: transcription elongation factor GreA [Planctomycetota bacterium]|nr:transcription elongation factor GreA [Planctomycetota bacterium]